MQRVKSRSEAVESSPPTKKTTAKKTPAKDAKPPKHTVPIEEHPGYAEDGEPQRTSNGPRPQDLKLKQPGQDPELDFSQVSSPDHGVLGEDEEVV